MKTLCIVKESPAKYGEVSPNEFRSCMSQASWNMHNDPEWNLERGISAMLLAYKEAPTKPDYVAIIGECGLGDVVLSSQNFFLKKIEGEFAKEDIHVKVEGLTATNLTFFDDTVLNSIKKDAAVHFIDHEMTIFSLEVAQGKTYSYRYLFERDRNVVVYKLTPK